MGLSEHGHFSQAATVVSPQHSILDDGNHSL